VYAEKGIVNNGTTCDAAFSQNSVTTVRVIAAIQLEKASTRESAKTHAGTVFVTLELHP